MPSGCSFRSGNLWIWARATTTVRGDRRVAQRELRRLLPTLDVHEHVDPSRMMVREWLTKWLAAVRKEVSPKSHERYPEIVDNFLAPNREARAGSSRHRLRKMGHRRPLRWQAGWTVAPHPKAYPSHLERRTRQRRRTAGDRAQSDNGCVRNWGKSGLGVSCVRSSEFDPSIDIGQACARNGQDDGDERDALNDQGL